MYYLVFNFNGTSTDHCLSSLARVKIESMLESEDFIKDVGLGLGVTGYKLYEETKVLKVQYLETPDGEYMEKFFDLVEVG